MIVAELRALLEVLPPRFDETEVLIYGGHGLCHVERVDLDRRKADAAYYEGRGFPMTAERIARKLRIKPSRTLWFESAPSWRLGGWWPQEAGEIGLKADGWAIVGKEVEP